MPESYRGLPATAWASYSDWQRNLVAKNRTNENDGIVPPTRTRRQQKLLGLVTRSRHSLTTELRTALDSHSDRTLECPDLSDELTADMIWSPQMEWELMLYSSMKNPSNGATPATRSDAAQVLFWVICNVSWLEAGHLQDPPLPALTKSRFGSALLRIDPAFLANSQRIQLDDAVRDILRCLGGIPHVRSSHIHHLMDCPAARAWWRVEISYQSVTGSEGNLPWEDCYEVFQQPGAWAAWAETAMTRTGTLSVDACSAGFVEASRRYRVANGSFPNKKESQGLIRRMASRTTNVYPKMLSYLQLADLCAN